MVERVGILGQGLVGTLLSFRLAELGVPHVVFDRGLASSASRAAAGLVNPVTGRRFVLVARYEASLLTFDMYDRLAVRLGLPLRWPLIIYRDLPNAETLNQWHLRRLDPAYAPYLAEPVRAIELLPHLKSQIYAGAAPLETPRAALPQMLGPTRGAWRVDLPSLTAAWREQLLAQEQLVEAEVEEGALRFAARRISVLGQDFTHVVDARGAASAKTRHWHHLPWRLSKGEALRGPLNLLERATAVKTGGNFLAPLGAGSDCWFGGTSTDHYLDERPEPATQQRLRTDLASLGISPNHTWEALAAVRPTMRNRLWVAEPHPTLPNFYICNGVGTRGTLDAPSAVAACLLKMGL